MKIRPLLLLSGALVSGALATAQDTRPEPVTVTPHSGPESRTGYPFVAMDKNKDGKVNLVEFTAAAQSGLKDGQFGRPGPTKPREGGVTGRATDPVREGGERSGRILGEEAANGIDRERAESGPGVPPRESAAANATELFQQLDKDGDGALTQQEVEAYQATQEPGGVPRQPTR